MSNSSSPSPPFFFLMKYDFAACNCVHLFPIPKTMSHHNFHLLKLSYLFLLILAPAFSLNLDGTLLLSLKYSILSDPLSVVDNWDYNDATPCLWTGVKCAQLESDSDFNTWRVVSLTLPNSKLVGTIPQDIGFIPHLKTLDLSNNFFNGTLPKSLFNASQIEQISLSNNAVSGQLPEFFSPTLKTLNLSQNALTGNIPHSIVNLPNLSVVSLSSNLFFGVIPQGVGSVQFLDLSSNLLNGSLPIEFGGEHLIYLNLSSNKLSGAVPPQFTAKIPANATIDLSFNDLSGELPESSLALSNQKTVSYAGNAELCGKLLKKLCVVPPSFSSPPNASMNSSSPAIAAIPKTIGTTPLPDSPQTTSSGPVRIQHGLKPGVIAGISVVPLAGVGLLATLILYIYQIRKKKLADSATKESSVPSINAYEFKKDPEASSFVIKVEKTLPKWGCLSMPNGDETSDAMTESESDENSNYIADNHHLENEKKIKNERSLVMFDGETELEIETLFKASAYVLGSSGATIVYKAVLQNGAAFAVRRIGDSGVERVKEIENRVKAIAKLRHQNVVRVRGLYRGDDEKLVIYDYVSNGSLANVGYRKIGSSPYHLPFETRLKIAKGVARGLTYIHDKKNVHGNIKPSNILLTHDMEPVISDLGLHWLIYGKYTRKSDSPARHFGSKRSIDDLHDIGSPCIGFVGCTSPYHAPESLNNAKPNSKWDVYSFGILLLELLTGKVFSERELSQWTAGSVAEDPTRVLRMTDVAIRGDVAGREDAMLAWFKLGFCCASLVPQKRPSMKDALHVLEKISC